MAFACPFFSQTLPWPTSTNMLLFPPCKLTYELTPALFASCFCAYSTLFRAWFTFCETCFVLLDTPHCVPRRLWRKILTGKLSSSSVHSFSTLRVCSLQRLSALDWMSRAFCLNADVNFLTDYCFCLKFFCVFVYF